ncbi:MAG: nucleoside monophosphate kinase [Minisyncoccia bacterium]|jgi:adenylate kinase family enzyme
MKQKPFNLILLGDPAAGKATQAAWIVKRYKMFDFDMGRELRRPAMRKTFDFDRSTAQGKLTPTSVVRDIFRRTITKTPASKGILFDGTPKMVGEARLVSALLKKAKRVAPLFIYLHIPVAEIVRRMAGRGRKDDTKAGLVNRNAYYRKDVAKTIAFFKKIYVFKTISGLGTRDEVKKRIEKELKTFYSVIPATCGEHGRTKAGIQRKKNPDSRFGSVSLTTGRGNDKKKI